MYAKKNEPPEGAANKGDFIEFVVQGVKYTGTVIGVYVNSVSVEADGDQSIIRNNELYKRTVVGHSEYKVIPRK